MLKALLLMAAVSCSHMRELDPKISYKKEIELKIDGDTYKGTAVIPKRREYEIKIYHPSKPAILRVQTCHRELSFRDPGSSSKFDFKPIEGLEDHPGCPLEIISLDEKGEHSWGIVDFKSEAEILQAEIGCNGSNYTAVGVSLCQAKVGLVQRISFGGSVEVLAKEGCSPPIANPDLSSQRLFEYTIEKGLCMFLFFDGKDFHRHMTFGYEEVLIQ